MPRFGAFTLLVTCTSCGHPLPVNAPGLSARCGACDAVVRVPAGVWGDLLVLFDDEHQHLTEGTTRHHTANLASMDDVRCTFALCLPRCACGTALPLDVALDAEVDVSCTGCSRRTRVYPVPGWLRAVCPTAEQVFSLDRGAGRDPSEVQAASAPVVIACPACGGGLHLAADGDRVARCRFCSAEVVLPARKVEAWFVRFDGETAADRRARVAREANEHNARTASRKA
jgi:hypothetical protein